MILSQDGALTKVETSLMARFVFLGEIKSIENVLLCMTYAKVPISGPISQIDS